jgi:uncharacterized BrkB/YihY/UPF0761 family membrane protein
MSTTLTLVSRFATGIVLGIATSVLMLITMVAAAFVTAQTVAIPGFFRAWVTSENDMPALNFEPQFGGILVVVILVAALYVLLAELRSRRARGVRPDELAD